MNDIVGISFDEPPLLFTATSLPWFPWFVFVGILIISGVPSKSCEIKSAVTLVLDLIGSITPLSMASSSVRILVTSSSGNKLFLSYFLPNINPLIDL